jgi:hypothetical protein
MCPRAGILSRAQPTELCGPTPHHRNAHGFDSIDLILWRFSCNSRFFSLLLARVRAQGPRERSWISTSRKAVGGRPDMAESLRKPGAKADDRNESTSCFRCHDACCLPRPQMSSCTPPALGASQPLLQCLTGWGFITTSAQRVGALATANDIKSIKISDSKYCNRCRYCNTKGFTTANLQGYMPSTLQGLHKGRGWHARRSVRSQCRSAAANAAHVCGMLGLESMICMVSESIRACKCMRCALTGVKDCEHAAAGLAVG